MVIVKVSWIFIIFSQYKLFLSHPQFYIIIHTIVSISDEYLHLTPNAPSPEEVVDLRSMGSYVC